MGNCCYTISGRKVAAQADYVINVVVRKEDAEIMAKEKTVVRLKLGKGVRNSDDNVDNKGREGVVRIRVVVTQKGLNQLLESQKGSNKRSSLELLPRIVRSRQVAGTSGGGGGRVEAGVGEYSRGTQRHD